MAYENIRQPKCYIILASPQDSGPARMMCYQNVVPPALKIFCSRFEWSQYKFSEIVVTLLRLVNNVRKV